MLDNTSSDKNRAEKLASDKAQASELASMQEAHAESLGGDIRALRKGRGMTLEALAET